ncbi:hypothetical protein [Streptomyces sp. NPDC001876]|uniref:hypothetical protein n=1 Tax=Streptomyces sp. NPDC001876 TaxID=3154402 RepID=UPI0033202EF4
MGETVNEAEARWIKRRANRALEGEKLYSLVMDAIDNGVKTSTGGDWSYQGIPAIAHVRPDLGTQGARTRARRAPAPTD